MKNGLLKYTLPSVLAVALFFPAAVFAQTRPVDLTVAFVVGGVTIDDLVVYQIADIVLIRGRTDDPAHAAEAGRFAARSGYLRVANLIEITPAIGDAGIEALAHHRLELARELRGCAFRIDSTDGSVRLGGQVDRENQRRFAIALVGSIEGVTDVRSAITLPLAKSRR
ncbi:MAG TPA: BON domain-containing protein [Thermoanaerobaculia bacterium]